MALAATALLQVSLRDNGPQPDSHLQKACGKDEGDADFLIYRHLETPDLAQRENEYDNVGDDVECSGVDYISPPNAMSGDPLVPAPLSGSTLFHSKREFDNIEHEIGQHQTNNRPKH